MKIAIPLWARAVLLVLIRPTIAIVRERRDGQSTESDYRKRVRYQTFDVTRLMASGPNAISALMANGWFSGHIGNGGFQFFGTKPAFLAQLEITYADGHVEKVVSDGTWKSHDSPILASDFWTVRLM